jgi:ribosomal protein S20
VPITAQNKNFKRTTKQTKAMTFNQTKKTSFKTCIKQNNMSYKTKIPSTGSVYKIFDGVAQVEVLKFRLITLAREWLPNKVTRD